MAFATAFAHAVIKAFPGVSHHSEVNDTADCAIAFPCVVASLRFAVAVALVRLLQFCGCCCSALTPFILRYIQGNADQDSCAACERHDAHD